MSLHPQPSPGMARATFETVLALCAAFLLSAAVTLPWVPVAQDVWVELRPEAGAKSIVSHEDLCRKVEEQGIAESARVVLHDGASRLELSGLANREEKLLDALTAAGYQQGEIVGHPTFDIERLQADHRALPIILTVQAAAFIAFGWLLARRRIRALAPGSIARPLRAVGVGVLGGFAAVAVSALLAWLLQLVGLPVEEQDWLTALYADPRAVARLLPWLVVLGPLSEEVFFRGYAFRYIAQEAGMPAGVLISSALFAVIHFNVSGFLVYLAIGCTLAWVQHRTNHLLAPVAGHIVINAVVLLASSTLGPDVGP